jgi:hypothetical protein
MTALSKDASLRFKGVPHTEIFPVDTSAAYTIYKGQPLTFTAATDTSHAVPFISADSPGVIVNTDVFIGIAAEHKVTVSGAVEADTTIEVYTGPSIVGFKSTVWTSNESLGLAVCMTDSGTLAGIGSADDVVQIGTLFAIEDGYCYVKLSAPFILASAGAA